MIVVIADDLSGAAELAGAAVARGRTAEVHLSFNPGSKADVVAIDTNSRWCTPHEARMQLEQVFRDVCAFQPSFIFKKVDSVLRGHVLVELKAGLSITGQDRALLMPANPGKGRVIREGTYYLDGQPLYHSSFAMDPNHPVMSSDVIGMLAASGDHEVHAVRKDDPLPKKGIVIPDADAAADLFARAGELDGQTLAAGGLEFFEMILERRGPPTVAEAPPEKPSYANISLAGPITGRKQTLFVCGSKTAWDAGREDTFSTHGIPVAVMPPEIFEIDFSSHHAQSWAESILGQMEANSVMMIAIGDHGGDLPFQPKVLVERLAKVIREVLRERSVDRLYVEGGETASAMLFQMHWNQMDVLKVEAGLPTLQRQGGRGPKLVVKPGSYPWPKAVWERVR